MSTPVKEGEILAGKYQVERVLGQGGMGVVVAAKHLQLEQKVALKFLLPEALGNQDAVLRFEREARAAVKIQSEHVARVTDVGKLETGAPYMVMEYLVGNDLSDVMKTRGALSIDEAVDWLLQGCEAMAEAHSLGIIHRDLKPKNLFIIRRPDGSSALKVLDFGISKSIAPGSGDAAGLTNTTAIMGSPLYMSPEQLRSSRDVDARTDIWALGVILYEMLAAAPPFSADTMPQLCMAIVSDSPPPISNKRGDLPQGLEAIVLKCLEKEPTNRYENVAQLARALGEFATQRGRMSVERVSRILQNVGMSDTFTPDSQRRSAVPGIPAGSTSTAWADSRNGRKTNVPANVSPPGVITGSTTISNDGSATRAIAFATVALGGLIVGGFFFLNSQKTSSATTPPPVPEVTTTAKPEVTAKPVQIKIAATPASASVYLDGTKLTGNPASATMKADGLDHSLRIEAPGFKTESRMIKFDKDVELPIELAAEVADPKKPVAGGKAVPGNNPGPGPAPKPKGKGGLAVDPNSPY
jgi:eukaryotic-like serine/threonine-protein kinase